MTAASQASAVRHRPSDIPISAASLLPSFSLKRQASAISSARSDHSTLSHSQEDGHVHKKQNTTAGPSTPTPPLPKFSGSPDDEILHFEFVDGFFLGSGAHQTVPLQSRLHDSTSPPPLPLRPWKHGSRPKIGSQGGLSNSGIRKRNDTNIRGDSYKTEPPHDAPKLLADSKYDPSR
jgi:hypothetical protein